MALAPEHVVQGAAAASPGAAARNHGLGQLLHQNLRFQQNPPSHFYDIQVWENLIQMRFV